MRDNMLHVRAAGIVTDGYADIREFGQSLMPDAELPPFLQRAQTLDPAATASYETLPQLAIRALHQAMTMTPPLGGDNLGLISVSTWGMIDSTAAYLESMFDAEGRYASPRHFSRSVYSTTASMVAIHFHIHGPCLTLAFDAAEDPINGALAQAKRLLAAKRCEHVAIVWAEQGGPIAEDLARRATTALGRHEYGRYVERGIGHGAVAVVLAAVPQPGDWGSIDLAASRNPLPPFVAAGKPFSMDGALSLLASIIMRNPTVD